MIDASPKRTLRSQSMEDSPHDYLKFSVLETQPVNCSALSHTGKVVGKDSSVREPHSEEKAKESSVNQHWNKMVTAAELVNGEYIDLISFMDDAASDVQNSSAELDNGSQVSIGVASSGYQSFGYSQSSSPIDTGIQTESQHPLNQPLSFANPLFHQHHSGQHNSNLGPSAAQHPGSPNHISRVTSSSSLSSDDGACSCPTNTSSSTNSSKGAHSSSSHSPYQTYHPSYNHDHKYARSVGDVNCISKLSAISSSSSSESLNKEPHHTPRRGHGHYGSYHRMNGNRMGGSSRGQMVHSHSSRSANLPLDLPPEKLVNSTLTVGELSKSVEFSLMSGAGLSPPLNMKRTGAGDGLHSATLSEYRQVNGYHGSHASTRGRNGHQNTVRMGVSAMHRKPAEPEKSKQEVCIIL